MREPGSDIRGNVEVLWARKWWVIVFALLGGILALALWTRQSATYGSQAKVLVVPIVPDPTTPDVSIQPNMSTEGELAHSTAVAAIVVTQLKLNEPPSQLLTHFTVDASTDSDILTFNYDDPRPAEAQRRTQAIAEAYLAYRRQLLQDQFLASQRSLSAAVDQLRAQLHRITIQVKTAKTAEARRVLRDQESSLAGLIVQRQLAQFALTSDPTVGRVVEPAFLPSSPAGPTRPLTVGIGVVLGAALGMILGIFRERVGHPLRSAGELETELAAPVLATVPPYRSRRRDRKGLLVALVDHDSATAEAFRVLRTNLLASSMNGESRTLLVTSAQTGEGVTTVVANLGVAFAQAGHSVIVVCADLRRPTLHQLFDEPRGPGLTDILALGLDPRIGVRPSKVDNLRLLVSGEPVYRPAELLGSNAMRVLLQQLASMAEFVLIEGGAILGVADGLMLAPLAHRVLFVADASVSDAPTIREARRNLDLLNVSIVGAVLNRYDPSDARRSYAADYGMPQDGEIPAAPLRRAGSNSRSGAYRP